jgi:hypothetical protein
MARRDWYCEDILSGKVKVTRVWEDDHVLAFHHPQLKAEIHVVVIPKAHVSSILDPLALDGALLSSTVRAVQRAAHALVPGRPGNTLGRIGRFTGEAPQSQGRTIQGFSIPLGGFGLVALARGFPPLARWPSPAAHRQALGSKNRRG